ncbi:sensor histidine kinase [Nocardioides sp. LML1-1-1.1]|uniref:sensor histidine kinase n=1 Tax=Nocardioides sp. LML1-1-1.1 TaxID=3135248 RepID=UPI0034415763
MRHLVPRSLTSRLVVTAVTLVAVVILLIGVVTTLAMRSYQMDRLDRDVSEAVRRADGPAGAGLPVVPPGDGGAVQGRPRFGQPGQVTLLYDDAGSALGWMIPTGAESAEATLSAKVAEVLREDGAATPHTVDLPGLGSYRIVADETRSGVTAVVGLPTEDVDDATTSLVRWEAALALLGILAAAAAGTAVVRRQLRPLTEVAATAHAVAELPLESGEIGVTERVPEHLTDPRTEAGQVGLALNQLLAHVESSLSARHRSEQQVRQFVADASHELRTPLTTIAGYTELARRQGDAETASVALAKVQEEAVRMTALVEDLLLLARLDAGRPLAEEPVDLTRLLLEAVDDARVVDPGHRWQIALPDDGEPIEVAGDGHRLHQVVTNLLANARKHTPAGTTVTVTVRPDGFDVHDDGPGFPPDLVGTAFERFTRGDAARHRSDGIGLGLALVQAIVAAHGGTVALASEPGDTVVRVRLPR